MKNVIGQVSNSQSNRFIVGGGNEAISTHVPMLVDDFEIWYGDRDYLCSRVEVICGLDPVPPMKHYIIG